MHLGNLYHAYELSGEEEEFFELEGFLFWGFVNNAGHPMRLDRLFWQNPPVYLG